MTRDDLLGFLTHDNVQGFLRVIRQGESNQNEDAYTILFGGEHFDSFADHPRRKVTRGGLTSTAAGAYQILERTWDGLVRQYGFRDFSPASQDQAAVALIAGRGALQLVLQGRCREAIARCAKEWASLPGSPYGQPTLTLEDALAVYQAYGGTESQTKVQEVKPMAPLVLPLLETLVPMIPQLAKLFGSGSEVSNRNNAALQVVADNVVKAAGAVNLQEAVERAQSDPQVLDSVKQAVSDSMFSFGEAGGGGIAAAREAALKPDAHPFWLQGAFWVSMILTVMPFMLLADVFYVHPDNYDGNLRTQIVTAVLLVISAVGAFWLGSSFGSQRKDALPK